MTFLSRNLLLSFFEKSDRISESQTAAKDHANVIAERTKTGLCTYVPERAYRTGEVTIYNGNLLFATCDTTGSFKPHHWQKVFALGSVIYKGMWDASANVPVLASGEGMKGNYYVVSVSGSTLLDGIDTWTEGDWIVYNGTSWERVLNADKDAHDAESFSSCA